MASLSPVNVVLCLFTDLFCSDAGVFGCEGMTDLNRSKKKKKNNVEATVSTFVGVWVGFMLRGVSVWSCWRWRPGWGGSWASPHVNIWTLKPEFCTTFDHQLIRGSKLREEGPQLKKRRHAERKNSLLGEEADGMMETGFTAFHKSYVIYCVG